MSVRRSRIRLVTVLVATLPSAGASAQDAAEALRAVLADEDRRIATFDRIARSVVCVFADRKGEGGGSGVIIDEAGYGLTNFHVVQEFVESRKGFGGLNDGKLYPLRLLGIDPGGDLAMFKLEGKQKFDAVTLGDSDALAVGQWVATMGNPFLLAEDYTPSITVGIISGLHRYQEGQGNLLEYADCIQVSTSINPGNSGGPLFDMQGRLLGINGRASFEERGRVNVGLGYAISVNQIKRFIPALRAGRLTRHGTLGATVRLVGGRLILSSVQDFSPAERAGLHLGDELLEVAGRRLHTANDYNNILATLPEDWPVDLRVRREERVIETQARLEPLRLRTRHVYIPELEQNHAEIRRLMSRYASTLGLSARSNLGQAEFRGMARTTDGDRPFHLRLLRDAGGQLVVRDAAHLNPAMSTAGADRNRAWFAIVAPLLQLPNLGIEWEAVGGDELRGRLVCVVQRRDSAELATRWYFDDQSGDLMRISTLKSGELSDTWEPTETKSFGSLRWPSVWTRTTDSGARSILTIESVTIAPVENAP